MTMVEKVTTVWVASTSCVVEKHTYSLPPPSTHLSCWICSGSDFLFFFSNFSLSIDSNSNPAVVWGVPDEYRGSGWCFFAKIYKQPCAGSACISNSAAIP